MLQRVPAQPPPLQHTRVICGHIPIPVTLGHHFGSWFTPAPVFYGVYSPSFHCSAFAYPSGAVEPLLSARCQESSKHRGSAQPSSAQPSF